MLAEISAGLSSLKAASDILKGLNAANTMAAINDVKIGLQERVMEAREALTAANEAQSTAQRRIHALEQEIVELKDWEREKQRYQLQAIDRGAFAYVPKPGMENGEPPHWLCPNCFSKRHKSFLQFKGQDARSPVSGGGRGDHSNYGCDTCKATVKVYYTRNPSTPWSPEGTATQRAPARPPGEACPSCGDANLRVEKSVPDPDMGSLGVRIHHLKCGSCGFTDQRTVT